MAPYSRLTQRHASDPGGSLDDGASTQGSFFPASSTGIPSVSRALSGFSFSRNRSVSVAEEDTWGPYGLNLLYSPPEPLLDLIFVHGLRGGSIKTWCYDNDLRQFWPKAWLPREPDLQNVRIHSFGYNADWANTKETYLDIHDFGRSLFGDMSTSPYLRHDKDTRIVLVGHSMGGLVMKKAFLLAHQDPKAQDLAARIQAMFFLATPHRGSDSAKLLNNILRASTFLSSRPYINDISRNSSSLQIISDEFRRVADQLQLWSFYETLKTKISSSSSVLIVDRESAVLGYKDEHVQLLNADHRNVCKFQSPSDPNYHAVRNSLAKAVEHILGDIVARKADETRSIIGSLEFYLGITSFAEDDLANLQSVLADGSCNWIIEQLTFQNWRDASENEPQVYWLAGQPGSGKSVTSAHVVTHLQEVGVDVCYYFFKHGNKEQQTISGCLRQIAHQMAILHPAVRQRLSALQESGVVVDKDDDRALWRKLFINEILKTSLPSQQFWVIDGLDECHHVKELFVMLSKLESPYPINLFFSSRKVQVLERHFTMFRNRVFSHTIGPDDTLQDIRAYIENHCDSLAVDHEYRHELVDTMVRKSDGSFLWTKLAFEELENVYSEDSMSEVLDEIPEGMAELYERVLSSMSRNSREVNLTKAILEWTVCGVRNLTVSELQVAMRLYLKSSIPNIERTVEGLCGQMVRIEKNGTVQLIHSTARSFLMDKNLESPFAIKRSETHEKLATVCLQYLCGDELKPPKNRALVSELKNVQSPFADYAATSWSDHLVATSSENNDLLNLVNRFLKTNVLSWIEFVAHRKKNLYHISRTAKNLRNYLDRRARYLPPLGSQFASVSQWTTDLLRIVAKFGRNLLLCPSAIYFVIPPLCPTESSIYKEFGVARGLLTLEGLGNTSWDDCISYIEHRETRAMSLAAGDNAFAIGLKSGFVKVYYSLTCQERASLAHGELVRLLKFDNSSQHIVTSGNTSLKMWSIDGDLLWSRPHSDRIVSVTFSQDDHLLVACTYASAVRSHRVMDGVEVAIDPFASGNPTQASQFARQAILSASISPDLRVMAVAYRGRPPQLWSLEKDVLVGSCDKVSLSVLQVLFNPNPSVELLAITYQDGELSLFRTWNQEEVATVAGDAYTMAATPDGRTIATGDMRGTIKLWDFESLRLLYCIKSPDYEIRSLTFSGDGLRLFDIRDTKSKVWEPAALVRKSVSDDSSISDSASGNDTAITVGDYGETIAITVMLVSQEMDCAFFGKEDGSVHSYDIMSGSINHLYSHRQGVLPVSISWSPEAQLIAISDVASSLVVWHLEKESPAATWKAKSKLLQMSWPEQIREVSLSPSGSHLLIRGSNISILQLSEQQSNPLSLIFSEENQKSIKRSLWAKSSAGKDILLSITQGGVLLLSPVHSGSVSLAATPTTTLLDHEGNAISQPIKQMTLDSTQEFLSLELKNEGNQTDARILLYGIGDLITKSTEAEQTQIKPILILKSSDIRLLLGFCGTKLAYLDKNLWVRSYDFANRPTGTRDVGADAALRHFFIPFELVGGNNGVDAAMTKSGDIVFPKEGELGVVRNALTWSI